MHQRGPSKGRANMHSCASMQSIWRAHHVCATPTPGTKQQNRESSRSTGTSNTTSPQPANRHAPVDTEERDCQKNGANLGSTAHITICRRRPDTCLEGSRAMADLPIRMQRYESSAALTGAVQLFCGGRGPQVVQYIPMQYTETNVQSTACVYSMLWVALHTTVNGKLNAFAPCPPPGACRTPVRSAAQSADPLSYACRRPKARHLRRRAWALGVQHRRRCRRRPDCGRHWSCADRPVTADTM